MTYVGYVGIVLISIYLVFSISNNVETRQENFVSINNSKNCLELSANYKTSIEFEKGFRDRGFSDQADKLEQIKSKELNCQ